MILKLEITESCGDMKEFLVPEVYSNVETRHGEFNSIINGTSKDPEEPQRLIELGKQLKSFIDTYYQEKQFKNPFFSQSH